MDIDNAAMLSAVTMNGPRGALKISKPANDSFSSMLDADRVRAENEAARDKVISNQKAPPEDTAKDDIEFIREHGMFAYLEKLEEVKREEIRAQILEAMGLTEEDLSAMSPEQRQTVEDIIADEIEKRLAAGSIMNDDTEAEGTTGNSVVAEQFGTGSMLSAQILAGETGALASLLIEENFENTDDLTAPDMTEEDG